jgi:hypothetical protein
VGRHVDDLAAPLRDHPRRQGLGEDHGGLQVDRRGLLPGVEREVGERLDRRDARIVYQYVNGAEMGERLARELRRISL